MLLVLVFNLCFKIGSSKKYHCYRPNDPSSYHRLNDNLQISIDLYPKQIFSASTSRNFPWKHHLGISHPNAIFGSRAQRAGFWQRKLFPFINFWPIEKRLETLEDIWHRNFAIWSQKSLWSEPRILSRPLVRPLMISYCLILYELSAFKTRCSNARPLVCNLKLAQQVWCIVDQLCLLCGFVIQSRVTQPLPQCG